MLGAARPGTAILSGLMLMAVALVLEGMAADQQAVVASRWPVSAVAVDGAATEWEGAMVRLEKASLSIGVANDGDSLWLCLTASEPRVAAQMLRLGLIVWFDPAGGTKKAFGIKYPVGNLGMDRPRPAFGARPSARDKPPEPIEIINRLELLGPGKHEQRSLVADQAPGIRVKVGQSVGVVVYELAVPLARTADHPYAIGARPGALIGVGLATPELDKSIIASGGPPRTGFSGPGGMSGRGGGGGMGGPPGSGRERGQPPKPMKWWVAVRLAAPPS
ncbi:MAG: hypothetical protein IMZ55_04120 [Acidobacteria bacterium]|nr:hypothetical protein [Acidobacteriota bacterium]